MQLAVLITMLLISVLGMHQFIVQPLAPSPEPPCVGQPRMVEDATIDEQELAALGKGGHCGRRQRYAVTRKQQRFIHRGSEAPHIYILLLASRSAHARADARMGNCGHVDRRRPGRDWDGACEERSGGGCRRPLACHRARCCVALLPHARAAGVKQR